MVGLAGVLGLRALAHRAILPGLRAPRVPYPPGPVALGIPPAQVQEAWLLSPGGRRVFGVLAMPDARPDAGPGPPVAAVLVMQGWGAHALSMAAVVPPLHAAGFAVLLLDARCHWRSDGEAFTSMPRFAEDIATGLAWLRCQPGFDTDRLAPLGHSVGAGAALLHAAQHDDVRAVVSLSAFAHPRDVMRRFMADKLLPYLVLVWYVMRHVQPVIGTTFDAIAPLAPIARVRCPVLLVHGRNDMTVPHADAQRLENVTKQARLLSVNSDHDLRNAVGPNAQTVVDFLAMTTPVGSPVRTMAEAAAEPDFTPPLRPA